MRILVKNSFMYLLVTILLYFNRHDIVVIIFFNSVMNIFYKHILKPKTGVETINLVVEGLQL